MENFITALWELRTWLALFIGIAIGLMLASLLVMARRQEEPEEEPTILILPPEEPMEPMEQVNMSEYVRRWS